MAVFLLLVLVIQVRVISQPACNVSATALCNDIGSGSEFIMTTASNQDFSFDSMAEYLGGITHSGGSNLKIIVSEFAATCRWQLHANIDNNAWPVNTEWELVAAYPLASGTNPTIDLLQLRVHNECSSALDPVEVYSTIANTGATFAIVEQPAATNNAPGAATCLTQDNVNLAGSYLVDYGQFHYVIDYRIIPTLGLKAGFYQVVVRYCLTEGP